MYPLTEIRQQPEPALFEAPLLPGRQSVLQQYYRVTRWATMPMVALLGIAVVALWDTVSFPYLMAGLLGSSAVFAVAHFGFVALLMRTETNRWSHRLSIGRNSISVLQPDGNWQSWHTDDLSHLRVIYTGHEIALGWPKATFNSNLNEVSFKANGKEQRLLFRLISPGHHRDFCEWMQRWRQNAVPFEEFDGTSGVPVKRRIA